MNHLKVKPTLLSMLIAGAVLSACNSNQESVATNTATIPTQYPSTNNPVILQEEIRNASEIDELTIASQRTEAAVNELSMSGASMPNSVANKVSKKNAVPVQFYPMAASVCVAVLVAS